MEALRTSRRERGFHYVSPSKRSGYRARACRRVASPSDKVAFLETPCYERAPLKAGAAVPLLTRYPDLRGDNARWS